MNNRFVLGLRNESLRPTQPSLAFPAKPIDTNVIDRAPNAIPIERKGNSPLGQSFSYTDQPPKDGGFGFSNAGQ